MSCRYCKRDGHNSRTCPEVPSRVFRPATERLGEAEARIAKLEDALRKARPLLRDIMDIHRDPEDGEYHECDTDPCAWCTEAKELVEQKGEG